jgi:Na+/H+ antiporter NhaC
LNLEVGPVFLSGLPVKFGLEVLDTLDEAPASVQFLVDGRKVAERELSTGTHEIELTDLDLTTGTHVLTATSGRASAQADVRAISPWLSLLPPLIAIALALITKEVLLSLFVGVFSGALFLFNFNPFTALARSIDRFVAPSVADPDNAAILIFTTLLGGMVGLINRSGGTLGIVERIQRFATNPRRGQLATWLLGIAIFFDDYSNVLIVGSTMRPITDRLKISREKLAYIVDCTAAPVASIFPISSWIGFEVGLIAAAFAAVGIPFNAYTTFVASIPYRFYPIFALVLGFTIAMSGRDFNPMLKAERRARRTGKLLADGDTPLANFDVESVVPPAGTPHRAINAILPIVAVVVVAIAGMMVSGGEGLSRGDFPNTGAWLREVFGNADSIAALCWASLTGTLLALALPLLQRVFTLRQGLEAMVEGFKSVFMALIVLILAWSIGSVCDDLQTADFLVHLTSGILSPHMLPAIIFVLAAAVAFATGSSWGTLGILMPLVVPVADSLSAAGGLTMDSPAYATIMIGTISSVLAGSVWGDHCSPISDTTILSSTASGSDHIAHVKTQLPYALSAGVIGILLGDIPTAFGMSPWISLILGSAVIVFGVLWFGKRSDIEAG